MGFSHNDLIVGPLSMCIMIHDSSSYSSPYQCGSSLGKAECSSLLCSIDMTRLIAGSASTCKSFFRASCFSSSSAGTLEGGGGALMNSGEVDAGCQIAKPASFPFSIALRQTFVGFSIFRWKRRCVRPAICAHAWRSDVS